MDLFLPKTVLATFSPIKARDMAISDTIQLTDGDIKDTEGQ